MKNKVTVLLFFFFFFFLYIYKNIGYGASRGNSKLEGYKNIYIYGNIEISKKIKEGYN